MNIKQWVIEQYEPNEREEIVNHGCVSGAAHGAIYYHETVELYERFNEEIWNMLCDEARDQGCTIIELIAQFNGQKNVGSDAQFKNLLVWYAIESICSELMNEAEND